MLIGGLPQLSSLSQVVRFTIETSAWAHQDPPEFMQKMLKRISTATGVHPNNAEPIFHLYVPQQVPANLHLDARRLETAQCNVALVGVFLVDLAVLEGVTTRF